MKSFIGRFLLCYFFFCGQVVAQTAAILPQGVTQFLDNNGNPLSAGKVDFFVPNTSTRKTTWQDAAKTIANANPVVLDSAGRAKIYGDGSYRQVVKTSGNVLIYDAVTAAVGGGGGDTGLGDGDAVGTIKPFAGLVAPTNYAFAYGQELSRTTFVDLFNAITLSQTINCVSASPTASGFSDTSQIPAGAVIESTCFAPGTVVVSKTNTTVTFNNNSSLSTSTTAKIFLFGNGNGTTTFNVPDMRGYAVAGRTNMGGTTATNLTSAFFGTLPNSIGGKGGNQSTTLVTANLPAYTPAGTVAYTPAGTINGTVGIVDPGHQHNITPFLGGGSTAGGQITPTTSGAGTINTSLNTTGITANFSGSFTGTPGTGIFTGTAQGGTSTAFSTVQPTQTLNYIIKIRVDSAGIATGITELTGDCTASGLGIVPITCTMTNGVPFGTMAVQNASGVAITNGTGNFSALSINGVPVGSSTDSFWSITSGSNIAYSAGTVAIGTVTNCAEVKTSATGVLGCNVFTPEQYGAVCDGSTDNTTAFGNMIAAVNAAGGGVIELARTGCTYNVFPSLSVPSVNGYFFDSINNLTFNCHGATINVPFNFSGNTNTVVYMFQFSNSKDVTFNDCKFDQSAYRQSGDATNGVVAYSISDNVVGLIINNHYQRGGKSGLLCQRGLTLARSYNVRASITTEDVYYPAAFARTCDNTDVQIHATRPQRAFFAYNVTNINAQVFSDNTDGPQDLVISNSYESGDTSDNLSVNTSNIKVQYSNYSTRSGGSGLNAFAEIVFQTGSGSQGPATIENIDLTMNIHTSGLNPTGPILKIENQGATPQSRVLRNVTVRGTSNQITPASNIMQLMVDKNWSGDFVQNLQIGPFVVLQGSGQFQIDGRGIGGPVSISSFYAGGSGGGVSYAPTNMNGLGGFVIYDRFYMPTLIPSPTP